MPPENNPEKENGAVPNTLQNPAPETPKVYTSPLKQIRTFQGDVASALGRQKESLFSIQQQERLKMSMGGTVPHTEASESKNRETIFLALGGVLLIAVALTGGFLGYREYTERTAPPAIAVPESRIISVQSEETLNFASTSREILFTLIAEKSVGNANDQVKHFVMRKGSLETAPLATAAEFMNKLQVRAPGSLVRSFEPIFMVGSLGESRYIIFKLSSFENAFPGMLTWEATMKEDIGPLFKTSQAMKSIGSASVFNDVIYRNKDVRVLSVGEGTSTAPVLLYSFFDNRMLIITDSLETLKTLVERLTQELLSR